MKPEYRIYKKCKSIGYGIAVSDAFLAQNICSAVQIIYMQTYQPEYYLSGIFFFEVGYRGN